MSEFAGNLLVNVGLVGELDALVVRVVRFFTALALSKSPYMRFACSMVAIVNG